MLRSHCGWRMSGMGRIGQKGRFQSSLLSCECFSDAAIFGHSAFHFDLCPAEKGKKRSGYGMVKRKYLQL